LYINYITFRGKNAKERSEKEERVSGEYQQMEEAAYPHLERKGRRKEAEYR
jgi:hypothetical protein